MSNEATKIPVDHLQRTVEQADLVEKLAADIESSPDEKKAAKLEMEMDRLAFFVNVARGDHAKRAKTVIEIARNTVLGRAITQPLPQIK